MEEQRTYRGVKYFLIEDEAGWIWELEDGTHTTAVMKKYEAQADAETYIRNKVLR